MSVLSTLQARANHRCELTQATDNLVVYPLPPESDASDADKCILVSQACYDQLTGKKDVEANSWRQLSETIWSPIPAVQVVAYRLLHQLAGESWAQDCLDIAYLEDDVKTWAEAGMDTADDTLATLDANGAVLQAGDNVTLIKDLPVKGAGFTAKRGTAVRGIALTDNPEHIEGRINGQRLVLVAKFLKKM